MAEYIPKLADKHFQNWMRGNLALDITREGVVDIVSNEMNNFHRDILKEILSTERSAQQKCKQCSGCSIENIFRCQTKNVCIVKQGDCRFHCTPVKQYKPCPNQFCDRMRKKIEKNHKFNSPSWKNTQVESWSTDPWSLAKCYLPPDGYSATASIAETDLNGLLSIFLNHKLFAAIFDDRTYIEEARDVGRKIRHTSDLCINDETLQDYIDKLCEFLESCRSSHYCAFKTREASQNLSKLKNEELIITTNDVTKILQEVIKERTESSVQYLDSRLTESLQQIKESMERCQVKTSKHIEDILTAKRTALASIEDCKASFIHDIKAAKHETVADIKEVSESFIKEIQEKSCKAVGALSLTDTDYQTLKQNLQEDLVTFYEDEHSTIQLTPLIPENDVDLIEFFVFPDFKILESTAELRQRGGSKQPLTSVSEIFMHGQNICRNIYITAEAGQGKTTFSNWLCLLWCHAKSKKSIDEENVSEEEIQMMKQFEFVFLIPLRFVHGNECDIDDMILSHVVNQLSRSHKYTHTFLKDLLHQERSLIILEGLDEWFHPKNTDCTNITAVPHWRARPKCTVVSTSRPWKMHEAKISKGKDNRHLEMLPLDEEQVDTLIQNVTEKLVRQEEQQASAESFNQQIAYLQLGELALTPVILIQLVCLLHDGKLFGYSRCDVYCSITDFMLIRCEEKLQRSKKLSMLSAQQCSLDKLPEMPESVRTHDYCKKYYTLLLAIGKLAHTTLLKARNDSALVFSSTIVEEVLSQDQLKCSLEVGILTKNKAGNSLSNRQTTFSFIHTTFQEFFSAFYLQTLPVSACVTDVLNICSSVNGILEMSGVIVFLCNLSPESCNELLRQLPEITSKDDFTRDFRSKVHRYSEFGTTSIFQEIQDMYVECTMSNASIRPRLQDLIVDDENCTDNTYKDALRTVANITEGCLKSLVVIRTGEAGNLQEDFRSFDLHKVHSLEQLNLVGDLEAQNLDTILARSERTLKCLSLESYTLLEGKLQEECVPLTVESIRTLTNMSQLEALDVTCFALPHAQLEVLVSFITEKKNLRQLFLAEAKCIDHDDLCSGFDLDLSEHREIGLLGLGFLPLSSIKYDTSCLENCYIGDFKLMNVFSEFLASLPGANNLREIEFDEITCPSNLERMFETIGLLHKLKCLSLTRIDFGARTLQLSADMVDMEAICLKEVKLSHSAHTELLLKAFSPENKVKYAFVDCGIIASGTDDEMDDTVVLEDGIVMPVDSDSESNEENFLLDFIGY